MNFSYFLVSITFILNTNKCVELTISFLCKLINNNSPRKTPVDIRNTITTFFIDPQKKKQKQRNRQTHKTRKEFTLIADVVECIFILKLDVRVGNFIFIKKYEINSLLYYEMQIFKNKIKTEEII